MNAQLSASLAVLEGVYADLTELLRQSDNETVNWTPLAAETNSIAALVTHTIGSVDSWLSRALGEEISRDRDAEFGSRASADRLRIEVEESHQRVCAYFQRLAELDLATRRTARRLARPRIDEVSAAWCIEHALIHAGEHWGQIQLTRQLFEAQRAI